MSLQGDYYLRDSVLYCDANETKFRDFRYLEAPQSSHTHTFGLAHLIAGFAQYRNTRRGKKLPRCVVGRYESGTS